VHVDDCARERTEDGAEVISDERTNERTNERTTMNGNVFDDSSRGARGEDDGEATTHSGTSRASP
jgi:hypothetical protein